MLAGARHRRAWSLEEKVAALDHLHAIRNNKRKAVRDLAIPSTKMLRSWLANEDALRHACANAPKAATKRIYHNSTSQNTNTTAPSVSASNSVSAAHSDLSAAVPAASLSAMVRMWLHEDCPSFDYGAAIVGSADKTAVLYAKSPGVLAGCVFFDAVFHELGCCVVWAHGFADGACLSPPAEHRGRTEIARVSGPARLILQGERVALNVLAECSGVATAAARVVAIARAAAWPGRIAGTRKTTPGFRLVQKYGMLVGGIDTHRMDLSSMVMAKDNHVAAAGGITAAVRAARAVAGFALKIDVECACYDQAAEAARAGADIVMLDNFDPSTFIETARRLRSQFPAVIIEGSGGLNELNLASYFCDEADILSFSVNRHASALDMSLKIVD
jgi:nicotinate-nucleotide pyrophosphorylase (carboxylating)